MLVLSRRPGQGLRIGADVELQILRIEGDRVVVGILAPREVAIVRSELAREVEAETRQAAAARQAVTELLAASR